MMTTLAIDLRRPRIVGVTAWLLSLAVLGGCGLGDMDEFAPLTPTDNFHVIKDGEAYRSAQLDATTLEMLLTDLDIRTVINLRGENSGEPWYDAELETCAALGVAHVDIRMSAHELPPTVELLALYDTFEQAEYPILIHCKAGADRTGAASAIWRMQIAGDSRAAALQELSPLFGHFVFAAPEMDMLAQIFEPSREWILNEYGVP